MQEIMHVESRIPEVLKPFGIIRFGNPMVQLGTQRIQSCLNGILETISTGNLRTDQNEPIFKA